ncbi:MAG: glutathione S-transferase [Gammaproteobacteria bacterium]|nr:MAG: glutathione S-transferase [Gammaproteobacteria bacterium]
MTLPYKILGAPGSPYSRKLRSVFRYRRIPFTWANRNSKEDVNTPKVPVNLLPVLVIPGENGDYSEAKIDSTPIIRFLEAEQPNRSVIPTDPVMAFIDYLIEDYADEWLTKAMFHFRWAHKRNVDFAGSILPRWTLNQLSDEEIEPLSKNISERQIERLRYVGSNETTGEFIEESYQKFIELLSNHLVGRRFVLGDRPGSSDFGIFGQLTQLAQTDPTCRDLTLDVAPRVFAWCDNVEDLSGLEPKESDWIESDQIPETLSEIFKEVGRTYAPFLLANAEAVDAGKEEWEAEIDGKLWKQMSFVYQAKCLTWIREEFGKNLMVKKKPRCFSFWKVLDVKF